MRKSSEPRTSGKSGQKLHFEVRRGCSAEERLLSRSLDRQIEAATDVARRRFVRARLRLACRGDREPRRQRNHLSWDIQALPDLCLEGGCRQLADAVADTLRT